MFLFISFHTEGSLTSITKNPFRFLRAKTVCFRGYNYLCAKVILIFQNYFVFSASVTVRKKLPSAIRFSPITDVGPGDAGVNNRRNQEKIPHNQAVKAHI